MKKFLLALLIFNAVATNVLAATDDLQEKLPVADDVRTGQLKNGLRYYLRKNAKPEQRAELRLIIKAGSVNEDDDQRGLAHFLEHMAFNGSTHFPKKDLISYLQAMGIRFGADLNAYTSFNETVYILPVPTDKPNNLDQALVVLKDWASGLSFPADEIEKERHIVLEEARQRKGVQERLNKIIFPELFKGSRYANRMPIGDETIISQFKPERLKQFYRDWYRPEQMAIIAVGDIDVAGLEQKLKENFTAIKSVSEPRPQPDLTIPVRQQSDTLILNDAEATQKSLLIRYPLQIKSRVTRKDDLRKLLIRQIAAMIVAERLSELTQQAKPPFNQAQAGWSSVSNDYESFNIRLDFGRASYEQAIQVVYEELLQAAKWGIQASELQRASENISRGLDAMRAEKDKQTSSAFVAVYQQNFLQDTPLLSVEQEYQLLKQALATIQLTEINRELASYPLGQAKFLVYTGPAAELDSEPKKQQLHDWVYAAETQTIKEHQIKTLASKLMDPPAPGKILSEVYHDKSGIYEWTLSNGLQVVLKPTQFQNDEILMRAQRFGGNLLAPDALHIPSMMALSMVSAMGMGQHTPSELSKLMAGTAASFSVGQGAYTEFVKGSAGLQDLEKLLQIQYLQFTQPRMDTDLFAGLVQRAQDNVKQVKANPDYLYSKTINDVFWQSHPRRPRILLAEDYASLDPKQSMALYQQRFSSAYGLRFIFVGNLQPAQLKPLMSSYLATLPTQPIKLAYEDRGMRAIGGRVEKDVYAGKEQKAQITIMSERAYGFNKKDALTLRVISDLIDLRINQVLREKLALIYSGGMSASLNRLPYEHLSYRISLPCAPENTERVKQALWKEIDALQSEGPNQEDLVKVKQALIKRHEIRVKQNGYWLNFLSNAYFYNEDPEAKDEYVQKLNALTEQEIREAARNMLDTKNLAIFTLYPENYKK